MKLLEVSEDENASPVVKKVISKMININEL